MKTYLQYGSTIKSKELMEAISIPKGIGPICGFGSIDTGVFNNNNNGKELTVKYNPFDGDTSDTVIKDKNLYHGVNIIDADTDDTKLVSNKSIGAKPVTFACITHDGYEYATNADEIKVPIMNEMDTYKEIMVFAYHDVLEVNIENPVYFKAFWNKGSNRLYDFCNNTYLDKTLSQFGEYKPVNTYESLVDMATGATGQGQDDGGVLIGIYGIVPNTNNSKFFSIVPYGGKVQPANLDRGIINYLDGFISRLKSFLGDYPLNTLSIKDYIDSSTNTNTVEPVIGVPIGGIIMWSDPNNIPEGFVICDGTKGTPNLSGRFVRGYGARGENGNILNVGDEGGYESTKLTLKNIPAHTHHIFRLKRNSDGNDKYGFHAEWENLASKGNVNSQDIANQYSNNNYMDDGCPTGRTGYEDPDAIKLLPPYTVLIYIMRIS